MLRAALSTAELRVIRYALLLGMLLGMVLSSCAPRTDLGPESKPDHAPRTGTAPGSVTDAQAGVVVTARFGAWTHEPRNLEAALVPILVEIDNRSGRRLRIDGSSFRLIRSEAAEFTPDLGRGEPATGTALPKVAGSLSSGGTVRGGPPLAFTNTGFDFVMSSRNQGRPDLDAPSPSGQRAQPPRQADLPSRDMLQHALAGGPLAASEVRRGFLYFEPLAPGTTAVLQAELIDDVSGVPFGTVRLPISSTR